MIREIIQAPDDRLRRVAQYLPQDRTEWTDEHRAAVEDLRHTFAVTGGCIGLAATQIDHHWRVIVVDTTRRRTDTYLMVNPVIVKASTDLQAVNDGCMSVQGGRYRAQTRRPKRIAVEWTDPDTGALRKQKFSGLTAAAIHHEVDHAEGVLFLDRIAAAMVRGGVR